VEPIDRFLTDRDRLVFKQGGFGRKFELGQHPALIIIDTTYEFTGIKREPILEAIKKVRTACGEDAWDAVDNIQKILKTARELSVPVLYTTIDHSHKGPYDKKNQRSVESNSYSSKIYEVVSEVAPIEGEIVIPKVSPSAFNGTNLLFQLVSRGIDTLIFTGGATSGCVRSSAVDAFAYGFKVVVAQDCVFDRGQASNAMSLFDLNMKYANVVPVEEAVSYLKTVK
jgi:maleamate amidohydrolase